MGHERAKARLRSPEESMRELEQIVRARVDGGRSTAIAAGMAFAGGQTRVVAHGDAGADRPLDEHTVFEIGSVTKVFTGTLLAQMAASGELGIADPVASLLPAGVSVASRGGREITLEDLATHSSGLPPDPPGHVPRDRSNPLADYTVAQLYASLGSHELTRDPGSRFAYSNLGAGLLGHALALRAGMSYEALVRERIIAPLGMTSTAIAPTESIARRLAIGQDVRGRAAPAIDLGPLPGAGALRSTVGDMLRFLVANRDGDGDPLRLAMAQAHVPRRRIQLAMRIGLGWHVLGSKRRTILFHGGDTIGFSSFAGLHPARGTVVVVLSSSRRSSVSDLGLHMLEPRLRLAPAPKQRTAIVLAPKQLERYAGVYDLAGTEVIVARCPEGLSVHVPGEDVDVLYPESKRSFFFQVMDAQVTFEPARGRVRGAVLQQDGQRTFVRKIG